MKYLSKVAQVNITNLLEMVTVMMKLTIFIVILIVVTAAIHASVKHFAQIVNV